MEFGMKNPNSQSKNSSIAQSFTEAANIGKRVRSEMFGSPTTPPYAVIRKTAIRNRDTQKPQEKLTKSQKITENAKKSWYLEPLYFFLLPYGGGVFPLLVPHIQDLQRERSYARTTAATRTAAISSPAKTDG